MIDTKPTENDRNRTDRKQQIQNRQKMIDTELTENDRYRTDRK